MGFLGQPLLQFPGVADDAESEGRDLSDVSWPQASSQHESKNTITEPILHLIGVSGAVGDGLPTVLLPVQPHSFRLKDHFHRCSARGGKRKVFRRCRELRTAMELMRHSDIRLTTAIYQHLELADTAGGESAAGGEFSAGDAGSWNGKLKWSNGAGQARCEASPAPACWATCCFYLFCHRSFFSITERGPLPSSQSLATVFPRK